VTYASKHSDETSVPLAVAAQQPVLPISLECATHVLRAQSPSDIVAVASLHRHKPNLEVVEDECEVCWRVQYRLELSHFSEGSESLATAIVGSQIETLDQSMALVS
jgi:hypothetical protein